MTDARWFEVDSDVTAAIGHFEKSILLYRKGGFDEPGLGGYQAEMALMHSLQSAHTSLESALVRILEILGEETPAGHNRHVDIIRRAAASLPGKRPPILSPAIAEAVNETRKFRHRATHNYDSFEIRETSRTIEAAEMLMKGLAAEIAAFQNSIDPPTEKP